MKQRQIPLLRTLVFIAAGLAAASAAAQTVAPGALPVGGQLVAGQASIQQSAGRMDIRQDAQKIIVNWNSFNIGAQAQVVFSQPNSSAVALNRVVSSDPSSIFGRLNANGQVFLVNPNGIVFAAGSSVNVGGLVAATLNIKDGEFLSGNYHFTRDGALGSIENKGSLIAADQGYIALLAPTVRNQGFIAARSGAVALLAGEAVTLGLQGVGSPRLLNLRVEPATVNALVDSQQAIGTESGDILFSAKAVDGLLGQAINNGSVVEANTIYRNGAKVMLDDGAAFVVFSSPPAAGSAPPPGENMPPPPVGIAPPPSSVAPPPPGGIKLPLPVNAGSTSQTVLNGVNQTISSVTANAARSMPNVMNPLPPTKSPLPGGMTAPVVPMLPQTKILLTMAMPGAAPMPVGQPGGMVYQPQPQLGTNSNQPLAQGNVPQQQLQPGGNQNQELAQGNLPQQPLLQGNNPNQPLVQGNVSQQQLQPGSNQNKPVAQGVTQKNAVDKSPDGKNTSDEGKPAAAPAKAQERQDKAETKSAKSEAAGAGRGAGSGRFAQLMAADVLRHQMRSELYKDALNILKQNPTVADLPACGAGAGTLCVPAPVDSARIDSDSSPAQDAAARRPVQLPGIDLLPPTPIGRKVAYLIGNNDYQGAIPALETPIGDIEAIGKQLSQNLGYEVNLVKNASRADIVLTLKKAADSATRDESVLIMYAGHGYQIDSTKQGYWIPTDASNMTPEKWVSNSDITKFMSAIPAKQVILISDSCFSGTLAKEQKMVATKGDKGEILSRRSVLVMSSGGEEPVSDEGKDGHSIFAYSLIKQLKKVSDFSTGSQVFENVKTEVAQEFPQEPQLGVVTSAGHTVGGDYLFEINQLFKSGLR